MSDRHDDTDRTSTDSAQPMTAFEQRLREGLHASAAAVQPSPDGWRRVQQRRRRRRTVQVGGLAVAGAAAVLAGVIVLGNVPDTSITFDPGVGDAPTVDVAQDVPAGPATDAAAIVYADADGVHMIEPDVTPVVTGLLEPDGAVTDLAVLPGGTPSAFTLVIRTEDAAGCGQLSWTTLGVDTGWSVGPTDGSTDELGVLVHGTETNPVDPGTTTCAGAPVFASDGSALAWLTNPAGPGEARTQVRVVAWADRFPEGEVQALDTSFPGADPQAVAWTVVPGQPAESRLHVRMIGPDGDAAVEPVAVSFEDGTLTVEDVPVLVGQSARGIPRVLDADDGWVVGSDNPAVSTDERPLVHGLTTTGIDVQATTTELTWTPGDPLFLDGLGNTAVMGNGAVTALTVLANGGLTTTVDLPAAVSAALLSKDGTSSTPTAAPTPTVPPEPSPTAPGGPTTSPTDIGPAEAEEDGTPALAAATADRLRVLAEKGDWAALSAMVPEDGFTASFGAPADPIAYYQQLQAEGTDVLGILADLLAGPGTPVPDTDLWAWPREFVDGEAYYGWRVGIAEDGTWRYFVAGD